MILLNLILYSFLCCQPNEWKGILPLKSTRANVEKILGKPTPDSLAKYAAEYKTKDEKVFVLYSSGSCHDKSNNGWDIPEQIVIGISVSPNVRQKFSDFKFDESGFDKSQDSDTLDYVFYTNKENGTTIQVDTTDDTITKISYFPEQKYNHLQCKNVK